jgi:hypothetical protein
MKHLMAVALLLLTIASCSPARRLASISAAHPEAAAALCAQLYPVKEMSTVVTQTRIDTQYLQGRPVYVDCDSAAARRKAGDTARLIVAVPCPPPQLITRLVTKDSIVRVESTAALVAARDERQAAILQATELRSGRNSWRLVALLLIGYCAVRLALRLWLKINLP